MENFKNKPDIEGLLDSKSSIDSLKTKIPKINFKKIKLLDLNALEKSIKTKNISDISINNELFSFERKTFESDENYNPEKVILKPLKKDTEEKNEITFNLKAEVSSEEENVILSPAIATVPPLEDEPISSSVKESEIDLAWPPKNQLEEKNKKKKKSYFISDEETKKKKKSYFISEAQKEKEITHKDNIKENISFPWSTSNSYNDLEQLFSQGLESDLLENSLIQETPETKESDEIIINTEPEAIKENIISPEISENVENLKNPTYKAINPVISPDLENIENFVHNLGTQDKLFHTNFKDNADFKENEKMTERRKASPLGIIFLGGATATLIYLLWSNFGHNFTVPKTTKSDNKVVVRNIFKKAHTFKSNQKSVEKNNAPRTNNEFDIDPITQDQRLALIEKARQAIEARIDPFGQETVLPPSTIEKLESNEPLPPGEVNIVRKQIELVGVVSSKEKDLALVNVYTADFIVTTDDTEVTAEEQLKTNLSMAVPNRIEVFVLDPVEDWYVKSINRSKSRNDDPDIELVKGNKKFSLKVGQRILLPSEKDIADLLEEAKIKYEEEQQAVRELGLTN